MRAPRYRDVEALRREFEARHAAIRRRLEEFAAVEPDDYFYELVYCLLTPQSSAVNAGRAVSALQQAEREGGPADVAEILRRRQHYIRFHNTKAKRVTQARALMPAIVRKCRDGSTPAEVRAWLVANVQGLGWKEASHFLRNVGFRDLAILDRHILRNLKRHGVLRALPRALTPKRYLAIERRYARFARGAGITMDELDLVFWSRETGEILK